jgi:hypothetical protein
MTDHDWGAILPVWLLIAPLAIGLLDLIATSASRGRVGSVDHGVTVAPTPAYVVREGVTR